MKEETQMVKARKAERTVADAIIFAMAPTNRPVPLTALTRPAASGYIPTRDNNQD